MESPHPDWTYAKFMAFIRNALRAASAKWPPKLECKRENRRKCVGKGRQQYEHQCNACKGWFSDKETEVDHIIPAGKLTALEDLPEFVRRLLCKKDGFQILCKYCHQSKTYEERYGKPYFKTREQYYADKASSKRALPKTTKPKAKRKYKHK